MPHLKCSILETPLYDRIYRLYLLFHTLTPKIPKNKRYTLWQSCENTTLTLLETLIAASHLQGKERASALKVMSQKLDLLKTFIRLIKDTKTLKEKDYLSIESLLQEIGRMIGGWLKSVSP